MSKPYIELISCEGGDWKVLRVNLGKDFNHEGHEIPDHEQSYPFVVWIALLNLLGFEVKELEISD